MDVLNTIFMFLTGLVAIIAGSIAIPIMISSRSNHVRKMKELEIRAKSQVAVDTQIVLDEIRTEMRALRDSSTKYNLSLDNSLQRIDEKIIRMDARLTKLEQDLQMVETKNRTF